MSPPSLPKFTQIQWLLSLYFSTDNNNCSFSVWSLMFAAGCWNLTVAGLVFLVSDASLLPWGSFIRDAQNTWNISSAHSSLSETNCRISLTPIREGKSPVLHFLLIHQSICPSISSPFQAMLVLSGQHYKQRSTCYVQHPVMKSCHWCMISVGAHMQF